MWVNLGLTLVWLVLLLPTMLWWKESILWVAMMSIWANVASHFAGYVAGRTEVMAQKGYNLTEADRQWLTNTFQLRASTNTMTIASPRSIRWANIKRQRRANSVQRRVSVRVTIPQNFPTIPLTSPKSFPPPTPNLLNSSVSSPETSDQSTRHEVLDEC
jgi:hypothetical protein